MVSLTFTFCRLGYSTRIKASRNVSSCEWWWQPAYILHLNHEEKTIIRGDQWINVQLKVHILGWRVHVPILHWCSVLYWFPNPQLIFYLHRYTQKQHTSNPLWTHATICGRGRKDPPVPISLNMRVHKSSQENTPYTDMSIKKHIQRNAWLNIEETNIWLSININLHYQKNCVLSATISFLWFAWIFLMMLPAMKGEVLING